MTFKKYNLLHNLYYQNNIVITEVWGIQDDVTRARIIRYKNIGKQNMNENGILHSCISYFNGHILFESDSLDEVTEQFNQLYILEIL